MEQQPGAPVDEQEGGREHSDSEHFTTPSVLHPGVPNQSESEILAPSQAYVNLNCFDQSAANPYVYVNKLVSNSSSLRQFNSYKVGAWNANGWKSVTHQENVVFKENVVKIMDLDNYLLSETHCFKNQILSIDGFKIFQYNRSKICERAIKGSGGQQLQLTTRS